jgi:hypothetical protein
MTSRGATPPLTKWVARRDRLDLLPVIPAREDDTACARNPPPGHKEAASIVLLVQPRNVLAHERVDRERLQPRAHSSAVVR